MTADGGSSHLQQFCVIICFVSTQAGCQKKLRKERDFFTGSINLGLAHKKTNTMIKHAKQTNTLERNSQNFLTKDQLYCQAFHSHAAMTSSLECVHRRTKSLCNMFALFKLINKHSSHIVMSDLAISTYTMSTHTHTHS